jgi:outer membrane protein insertion porin family
VGFFPGHVLAEDIPSSSLPGLESASPVSRLDLETHALVEAVYVKGNQRIEADAILTVVRTSPGNLLDYEKLDRDLRDIYRMGYFSDVRIEEESGAKGKIIIFVVKEKPIIGKIVFEGNKEVKEEKLKEELGIEIYSVLDPNEVKQSVLRLIDLYKKKGFYNVTVKENIEEQPDNSALLKYIIEEHEKVYIKDIKVLGNKVFDDDDIKDVMMTKEKSFLSWITDAGYLDKKKLEYDVHQIGAFYHMHGYVKAIVGAPKVFYDDNEKGLFVTIEIEEGPQYRVNSTHITGDLIKDEEELLKSVHVGEEEDKIFNRQVIREDIDRLKEIYSDYGYAYVEVFPEIKQDNENLLVDISYRILKGHKVVIERINIIGNTRSRDKIVRRELWLMEGDYFGGKKLAMSKENLDRLGFFEETKIEKKRGSSPESMILDVKVKEGHTGSFSVGAGFSSVDSLVATAQISENNFRGLGQRIATQLRIGSITNQFDVTFSEPWLYDRPVSGTFRLYKWEREYDEWNKDSQGGEISLGFPMRMIDFYTSGWAFYRYDDSDISEVDWDAAWEIREMEGRWVTSSIGVGLKRASINRAKYPSKGSINSFSVEWAGGFLGGDNDFIKYTLKSQWFFGMPKDSVIMAQGRWGYIDEREGKLPVYERFFLGGIDTVRGFDYQEISPRDPVTGDEIGGEKMFAGNLEYRYPLSKDKGLVGVVFFDVGNVVKTGENLTSGIRKSAGIEIRWESPMGPIRVVWGYNISPQYDEKSSKFDFSMGGAF